jgi:hypothetical protein
VKVPAPQRVDQIVLIPINQWQNKEKSRTGNKQKIRIIKVQTRKANDAFEQHQGYTKQYRGKKPIAPTFILKNKKR